MSDDEIQDFIKYAKWMITGWIIGLIIGFALDAYYGFGNPLLEGLTRFITGYGDTIGASTGMIINKIKHKRKSAAETFWIGTLIGSIAGPAIHYIVILTGASTLGIAGAIYAIAYSNADNWGGVIYSIIKGLKQKQRILKNKFIIINVIVLITLAILAISARIYNIAPNNYLSSAIESALLDNDSTLAVLIFFIYTRKKNKN